jgi:hypothetical protein
MSVFARVYVVFVPSNYFQIEKFSTIVVGSGGKWRI